MDTKQQKVKKLIDSFRRFVDAEITGDSDFEYNFNRETEQAGECALVSVSRTIAILRELHQDVRTRSMIMSEEEIYDEIITQQNENRN